MNKYYVDNYICIDIETTGLKPNEAEIIEIACADVNNGTVIKTYSSFCSINSEMPKFIENLTGINNKMIESSQGFYKIITEIFNIFKIDSEKKNILIHNVNFDKNFIDYWIRKNFEYDNSNYIDYWELNNFVCSLEFSKIILPNQSHKLDDLKKYFGIKSKGHRALNDVLCTIKVYEELKKILI